MIKERAYIRTDEELLKIKDFFKATSKLKGKINGPLWTRGISIPDSWEKIEPFDAKEELKRIEEEKDAFQIR